jgi:hypothetical protein
MDLYHSRWIQERVKMVLRSLIALCKAPGVAANIRNYIEALVRVTEVAQRFSCILVTKLQLVNIHRVAQQLPEPSIQLCFTFYLSH